MKAYDKFTEMGFLGNEAHNCGTVFRDIFLKSIKQSIKHLEIIDYFKARGGGVHNVDHILKYKKYNNSYY